MSYTEIYSKKIPIDIKGISSFFVLYRPDPDIPAVQVQLEDGQTYDLYARDFESTPQVTKLPLWEELLRNACADGQAVYIFGQDGNPDSVKPFRMEPKKDVRISVVTGLRENAISVAGKARRAGRTKNIGSRGYSTF